MFLPSVLFLDAVIDASFDFLGAFEELRPRLPRLVGMSPNSGHKKSVTVSFLLGVLTATEGFVIPSFVKSEHTIDIQIYEIISLKTTYLHLFCSRISIPEFQGEKILPI